MTISNVAGLNNKDKDFWKALGKWDMVMLETWMEEKKWEERIRRRLPRKYVRDWKVAKRERKKARATGEILMDIKKN